MKNCVKNADVDHYLYNPKTGIVTTEAKKSYKNAMVGIKKNSPSRKKGKSPSSKHYGGIKKIYNNVNKKTRKNKIIF